MQTVTELLRDNPTKAFRRFLDYTLNMPPTGSGCHPKLLGAASLAKAAELSEERAVELIEQFVKIGTRSLTPSEVADTVAKAYSSSGKPAPRIKGPRVVGSKFRSHLNSLTQDVVDPVSFFKAPVSLAEQYTTFLTTLYRPEERVYLGSSYGKPTYVPTVSELLTRPPQGPYVIPNPVTGKSAPKKSKPEETSLRCDAAIASLRFLVCEIDKIDGVIVPLADQLRLWIGAMRVGIPVAAITWSGGKSAHVLVPVKAKDTQEWRDEALGGLFYPYLVPMGVDNSCSNPARLSRSPGFLENGRAQPLIYVDRSFKI